MNRIKLLGVIILFLGTTCPDSRFESKNLEGYVASGDLSPISGVRVSYINISQSYTSVDSAVIDSSSTDIEGRYYYDARVLAIYSVISGCERSSDFQFSGFTEFGILLTHSDYHDLFVIMVSDSAQMAAVANNPLTPDTTFVVSNDLDFENPTMAIPLIIMTQGGN